ncbi:hypothetical protein ABK040_012896 [Willaertia magna]
MQSGDNEEIIISVSNTNTTTIVQASADDNNTFGNDIKKNLFVTNKLPFKIKRIKCAGEYDIDYTLYWTIDNEFYLAFDNSRDKTRTYLFTLVALKIDDVIWKLCKINLEYLRIMNRSSIKNVKCSGNCLLFELHNQQIVLIDCRKFDAIDIPIFYYTYPKLKRIKRGCVSNRFVLLMNNNEMKMIDSTGENHEIIDLPTFNYGEINQLALSNESIIIVTNNNQMYGYGPGEDNQFNGIHPTSNNEWIYIETIFEKESKVKSLKCGYSHTVVLLQNGNIYGVGLNSIGQAGKPNPSQNDEDSVTTFTKFSFSINLIDRIETIYCLSRGTILQTNKEFICLGEIAINHSEKSQLGDISVVRLKRENNYCSTGPWHLVFYYKEKNDERNLKYFLQKLKDLSNQLQFAFYDIDFIITTD